MNYKAKWKLFSHCTNVLARDLQVQGRDINHVVRELNSFVLQAAHECIPRGTHKDYKPFWSNQMQELQDEMTEARQKIENHPSDENDTQLEQTKAKFLKAKLQARRQSWREKTAALNLEKDGKKLWRHVGQLNDKESSTHNITLEENEELLTDKLPTVLLIILHARATYLSYLSNKEKQEESRENEHTKPPI